MHFSSTSRNPSLNFDGGVWLYCECQTVAAVGDEPPPWIGQYFPLHEYFHVATDSPKLRYGKNGGFSLTDGNHLDKSDAKLIGGAILKARVKGTDGDWAYAFMCLDFFLTNDFGTITCDAPSQDLCASTAMLQVSQSYNYSTGHSEVPLTGLCIGLDGQLHASSIDLCLHYMNDNGLWAKEKYGYFGDTAKDVRFDSYGHFNCELKRHSEYRMVDIDLYQDVFNIDGVLSIQDPAGFWDSRGSFLRILEEIPFLGYAVAVADFAMGDEDEAHRAEAECTLSTIAAVACFCATAFLGPVGACLAAAAINTSAMLAKEGMKANLGEPSFFTKSVGAAMAGFFFSEFLVIVGAGLDGMIGNYMDLVEEEFVASSIEGMVVDVGTWGGKKALKTVTNEEFKFLMTTVLDCVKRGGSLEDAQAEVEAKIEEWFEQNQVPELKKTIATKMDSLGYTCRIPWISHPVSKWLIMRIEDDQTILDDIYKATVAADYQDDARLQKAIEAAVDKIIPCTNPLRNIMRALAPTYPTLDSVRNLESTIKEAIEAGGYIFTDALVKRVEAVVTKYVYRTHDDLVKRITYFLEGMDLDDPGKVRKVKLSIMRIGYVYDNAMVTKLLGMLQDSDYGGGLDEALKKIFLGFPDSDRKLLDAGVKHAIYAEGFFEQAGDRQAIENDLIQNEFIYDNLVDLSWQLSCLVHTYCSFEHQIMPSAKPEQKD